MPRVSVIAKNYAKALYVTANKKGILKSVVSELEAFKQIFNSDFVHELKNPVIPKLDLVKIMKEIEKKITLSKITSEFFLAVIRNRRINLFPEIYEEFVRLTKKFDNVLEVEVVAIDSLDRPTMDKIKNLVARKYPNKSVEIKEKKDAKILGGFQIKIGSEVIDASLRNQLSQLSEQLAVIN